jgi:hypothetical protein
MGVKTFLTNDVKLIIICPVKIYAKMVCFTAGTLIVDNPYMFAAANNISERYMRFFQ